jgi:aspartyl/asparaginyl-tRNA synthetase
MNEKLFTRVSVLLAVSGLIGLFIYVNVVEFDSLDVNSITYDDVGNAVKVCGNVSEKYISKNNHLFFRLSDETGGIKVVVFNSTVGKLDVDVKELKDGDSLCVLGNVDVYKDELEVKVFRMEVV